MHCQEGVSLSLNAKLLGFEFVKELYVEDFDFSHAFVACWKRAFEKFHRMYGSLFRENKSCIPSYSMHELLVWEAHGRALMWDFGVKKTLATLQVLFFWLRMTCDVKRVYGRCIQCKQAKSRVLLHWQPWCNHLG